MSKSTNTMDAIPTAKAEKKGKIQIPIQAVSGDSVKKFAQASDDAKTAKKEMDELRPTLQEEGIDFIFSENVRRVQQGLAPISSVNLVDKEDEGEKDVDLVQFSWTRKNMKNDHNAVEALFERIKDVDGHKVKSETYVEWQVGATFDTSIFKDASGKFSMARYNKVLAALDKVASELKVENPLACSKVLAPKDDFHDRRFKDFDAATNELISAVLPTTLQLEAIRPAKAV